MKCRRELLRCGAGGLISWVAKSSKENPVAVSVVEAEFKCGEVPVEDKRFRVHRGSSAGGCEFKGELRILSRASCRVSGFRWRRGLLESKKLVIEVVSRACYCCVFSV